MRRGRVLAVVAAVLVAAVVAVVVPWPAGRVVDVADRFRPEGRDPVSSTVEPRRLFCLGGNPCPSVHQRWSMDAPITTSELQAWLDEAGYDAIVEGRCEDAARSFPCSARGTAEGFRVSVFVRPDVTGDGTVLVLSLR